jgi:hypothetical protein
MDPHSEGERVATSINQTENLLFFTMLLIMAVITGHAIPIGVEA